MATAAEVFSQHISGLVVQSRCAICHVEGGPAVNTRLVFASSSSGSDHEAVNLEVFATFLSEVEDGTSLILNKIQGVSHGGGTQVPAGSEEFAQMERLLELLEGPPALFSRHISEAVVQSRCIACHVGGGVSGNTRLVFEPSANPDHKTLNLQALKTFLSKVEDGASLILNKIQGVSHGGGEQVPAGSAEFAHVEQLLAQLDSEVVPAAITVDTLFDPVRMAPLRKTLRRAALIFAGRIPTEDEYAAIYGGAEALRGTIRNMMTGPEFHEFLIRGANDRLLTDRDDFGIIDDYHFVDFTNEQYRRKKEAQISGQSQNYGDWYNKVQHGARRAPLELIAHVVENDLPYTEILTADYIMANPFAARAYGASTAFSDPEDPREFRPSKIVSYYREGEDFIREYDRIVDAARIIDPGSLRTDYPHAGILNTTMFLRRYPTTATNRNRARARWTYYHFLGVDIEKSAPRTMDPVALADPNNPTMHNPACTVCHRGMDPVAGAFQDYGDVGFYRDQWGGMDSLDDFYKRGEHGTVLNVEARTWQDRESLTWSLSLPAGSSSVRVTYTNPWWFGHGDAHRRGHVYLDRLNMLDDRGRRVSSLEFEDLDPPLPPGEDWEAHCADKPYNPSTGREDYLRLNWGGRECALRISVDVPTAGVYTAEIVAWSTGRDERYDHDGYARLGVSANGYEEGDTWYRDMRVPGIGGEEAPEGRDSLQWLAQKIAADPRFAEATVKFWWPAIMGSEVAEPPAEEVDADFEGQLLAANAQHAEVRRLAAGFRGGFHGGKPYNLKDLLVEIVLSEWFRADALGDMDPVRRVALRDAGARRLLTPEELARKTASLTGFQWGRHIDTGCWGDCEAYPNELTGNFGLLYGGIDSDGITKRARNITSVMAGVAKRNAVRTSCPVVMRDFFLVPDENKRLFGGLDRFVRPDINFNATFEIEAGSRSERETLSLEGSLPEGSGTVRLSFTNDYWGGNNNLDRNVHLDRLDLRNEAGRVVASYELEDAAPEADCMGPNGDNYGLWCNRSLDVLIDVPAPGRYTVEVVVWADQAGEELARLDIAVLDLAGSGGGATAIREKLVELHDKLLGIQVTPHSPEVNATFKLFVDTMERRASEDKDYFSLRHCPWWGDIRFFDGILDDIVVKKYNEWGLYYDFDGSRTDAFFQNIDFGDSHHAAQAWVAVLSYLLMDLQISLSVVGPDVRRRSVIKGLLGLAATAPGFRLPLVHAQDRTHGKLFIFVQADGGWDPTSFCDPKSNTPGEPVINHWAEHEEIRQAGNLVYAPFAANRAFFEKYHRMKLMINGVDAQTNSHSVGIVHNWSGWNSEGYPTLSALLAAHFAPALSELLYMDATLREDMAAIVAEGRGIVAAEEKFRPLAKRLRDCVEERGRLIEATGEGPGRSGPTTLLCGVSCASWKGRAVGPASATRRGLRATV